MEGPTIRTFPRTLLDKPVELQVGRKRIRLDKRPGNLSAGGVFVEGEVLPEGTPVHVHIAGKPGLDADGVIRYTRRANGQGVGIEFTHVDGATRQQLDQLIAELTVRGLPAC